MGKIYLIRHVETEGNKEFRYIGRIESNINNHGKEQLKKINTFFKDKNIDKIYASPRKRAVTTAKEINGELIIEDNLREIDFGLFEGLTYKEILDKYPEYAKKQIEEQEYFQFPDGESEILFYNRISEVIDNIIKNTKDSETIAIVTHGGVIRMILSHLLTKNNKLFWKFNIDNASISEINIIDNYISINKINFKIES